MSFRPVRPARLLAALLAARLLTGPLPAAAQTDRGFDSAEDAFASTFLASGLAQRAFDENREYAAALYQMPDGRWHSTAAVAGDSQSSSIPYHQVPPAAVRIAGAHSHGQPVIPGDSRRDYGLDFSGTDRAHAMQAFRRSQGLIDTQLLLTSRLEVLRMTIGKRFDPATAQIAVSARTERLDVQPGAALPIAAVGSAEGDSGPAHQRRHSSR